MKSKLRNLFIPGINYKEILKLFFGLLIIYTVVVSFFFIRNTSIELLEIENVALQHGTIYIVKDFISIFRPWLIGYFFLALYALCLVPIQYAYSRRDSRADYTLRRVPHKLFYHKRCLRFPLLSFAFSLLSTLFILILLYVVYMAVIPDINLAPDQWAKIWSI